MPRQQRHIFLTLAQRWNKKRNHIQPVEQVFPKISLRDFFFQILVRRRNHPHVHRNRIGAPHRRKALFVKRAQYLGLRLQAHVAHFIQEQSPAGSFLKLALLVAGRSGKRTLPVPEKLAFNQVLRNRRAIHFQKHLVLAKTLRVDGMRHQFFPGPRFAVNQNPSIGRRHNRGLLAQRLHGNAVSHDHALGLQLLLQVSVFVAQLLGVNRVLDQDQGAVNRERLLQKVVRPQFGGAHRGLNRAVPGDHDHFRRISDLANFL